jgi:hypothetical protein
MGGNVNISNGNTLISSATEHKVQYMGGNLRGKFSARSDEIPHCVSKYYINYNFIKAI